MKHTPEPWKADIRTGCFAIYQQAEDHNCLSGMDNNAIVYQSGRGAASEPGCYLYLTEEQSANAARIVACVNACSGIPTSWLEGGAADILEHSQNLLAENTRLKADAERLAAEMDRLASLQEREYENPTMMGVSCAYDMRCIARAALAEHERGEG